MFQNIKILTIHLTQTQTQKVGTLAIKNKKIYFEYDKSFLKTTIGVESQIQSNQLTQFIEK